MSVYIKPFTVVKPDGPSSSSYIEDVVVSWATDTNWPANTPVEQIVFFTESVYAQSTWKHSSGFGVGFHVGDIATPERQLWGGTADGSGFGLGCSITNEASGRAITTGDSAFIGQVNISIANVISKGNNTFTLRWNIFETSERIVHGFAIHGATNADLVPVSFNTGAQSYTGLTFCPDLLMGFGFVGAGDPGSSLNQNYCLGFANHGLQQAVLATVVIDTGLGAPLRSNAGRFQREGRFYARLRPSDAATPVEFDVEVTAFTDTGFTYIGTQTGASIGTPTMWVLALRGVASYIGTTLKPTGSAPATHTIPYTGMTAVKALLLASVQEPTAGTVHTHDRLGVGVYAPGGQFAQAHDVQDDYRSVTSDGFGFFAINNSHAYSTGDRCFLKVNNSANPGPEPVSGAHVVFPTIEAEAIGQSLSASLATLSWTTNDGTATSLIYVALGAGTSGVCGAEVPDRLPPAFFQVPGTNPTVIAENCATLRRYRWQLGPFDGTDSEDSAEMYELLHRATGIVDGIWVHKKIADLGSVRLCEWVGEVKSTATQQMPGEHIVEAVFVERPRTRPCDGEL